MNPPVFVLRARELRAARGVTVATDVALTASAGDVIAVEGPNGSGKTTLLAAAAGLLPATNVRVRPASIAISPERASLLPRMSVLRWLVGLARTAGLSRADASMRARDLLGRLRLEDRPLHVLSRGNTQRALVAQALVSDPDLLILDEPAGGMDADGVARVAAEIIRAADRRAVVLVARHPTAPLPLPAGTTWRFADGTIQAVPRDGAVTDLVEVETGDGVVRKVLESELPGVLRAALDTGVAIRRVQAFGPIPLISVEVSAVVPPRRAGMLPRLSHGAAHRAQLLAASQWFAAPMLVFLAVLSIMYATDAGPPLQPAAVTAIALIPMATWLTVLAHRVDGRELARAFAAHAGGRARAHLATDICVVPYVVALGVAAIVWPLASQGSHPHPAMLVLRMLALQLAAAAFGIGLGSLLALIDRIGWRLIVAVAVFLGLVIVQPTPLTPLLRLSTAAITVNTPVGTQIAWMSVSAVLLMAVASCLATRTY
jgi:ABC-type Mn2+/Zn2+ transport system ATPase subunit